MSRESLGACVCLFDVDALSHVLRLDVFFFISFRATQDRSFFQSGE